MWVAPTAFGAVGLRVAHAAARVANGALAAGAAAGSSAAGLRLRIRCGLHSGAAAAHIVGEPRADVQRHGDAARVMRGHRRRQDRGRELHGRPRGGREGIERSRREEEGVPRHDAPGAVAQCGSRCAQSVVEGRHRRQDIAAGLGGVATFRRRADRFGACAGELCPPAVAVEQPLRRLRASIHADPGHSERLVRQLCGRPREGQCRRRREAEVLRGAYADERGRAQELDGDA
mmetsp:Transcript_121299/g.350279  ORF Transcript_121299/g.350279 Transcript_121299/m.350279 type:complete len:232 (-) Transcript_121299:1388-2083(-)